MLALKIQLDAANPMTYDTFISPLFIAIPPFRRIKVIFFAPIQSPGCVLCAYFAARKNYYFNDDIIFLDGRMIKRDNIKQHCLITIVQRKL